MRLLYVMPTVTHPTMRGELRHHHLVSRLARSHRITLLTLVAVPMTAEALEHLQRHTSALTLIDVVPPPRPQTSGPAGWLRWARWRAERARRVARGMADLRSEVARLLEREAFDAAVCFGPDVHALVRPFAHVPSIVDWCDAHSLRLKGELRYAHPLTMPAKFLAYARCRLRELRLPRQMRELVFISRRDRQAVMGSDPRGVVIPNGVDTEYWRRPDGAEATRTIVFTGVLDYRPNADAALHLIRRVAPIVRRSVPDLEVVIAGRNPMRDLLLEAERWPRITVTGSVQDLRPHLARAGVFVAPLRFASGMQNKLLEAMAMEVPVVTTPVAADGLRIDDADGPPVAVAADAGTLAAHAARFLLDPAYARQVGAQGRAYVLRHCDWDSSARALERLCRQAACEGRRAHAGARLTPTGASTIGSRP
jgi:glycosyltransferase involved in cell wall biosynthesis